MRILFLSDNFPPEVNAPATRTYEHCKEWVLLGADVTIITCFPNFPQGKVYAGFKNKLYQKEEMHGITVIRVWTYITSNAGFFRRTLDFMSFAIFASIFGLFQKADIIVTTSPQFFTTWAGWFLSKVKRKPWVFELRDLWPESIASVGSLNVNSKIYKTLEKIELGLYKSANLVIPNSPSFKTNLVQRGINEEKILVVSNGANLDLFKSTEKDAFLLDELKLYDKFIIGYIGTHGLAHSLDFIIDAISDVTNPNIHFLFVGDGAMKSEIVYKAKQLDLKNVTFLDSITKEEVPRYLSITDVALIPLKKSDTFKTVIPSKIFESCAMGKPIILGVEGQARDLIKSFDCGIYFEPENKAEFLKAVKEISTNRSLYDSLQKNGYKLAQKFNRKDLAIEMLEHLKKVSTA